ncbi:MULTISPECIES: J domain-containing protein [Streptacidiphilus]|uniref:J domain-containing protein n=2 Tax=Streptacidiphilus TaxID=228398 RepID=A0ABV6UP92_9ACTN|nr:J domain-containing protein [Streptacidiphilus jeojiense]
MAADSPVRWIDPEEQRLEEQIAQTEARWVDAEVEVETLRVELDNFALVHHQRLGPMYVRLDELDALIAEATAARTGDPEDIRRAFEARNVVEPMPDLEAFFAEADAAARGESDGGAEGGGTEQPVIPQAPQRIRPDKEAQRLYRDLARRAHPDLAQDPAEQELRGAFIARVNEAYARGDVLALAALAEEWAGETGDNGAPAEGTPERLAWLRQRLDWLTARLRRIEETRAELVDSPMGQLLMLLPDDPDALLEVLAEQLLESVSTRQAELDRLVGTV